MKKNDLIALLQAVPGNPDVAVFDFQKNSYDDTGDGSHAGIHPGFKIEMVNDDVDPQEWASVSDEPMPAPWLAICFMNEDYDDDVLEARHKVDSIKRHCRVCGCTDDNCSQCIQKTGRPCHWVEDDLCSACVEQKRIITLD